MKPLLSLIPVFSMLALAAPLGWRNDGTGLYPKAVLPASWGPSEKVVWATPLPDWGNSCPVVLSDRILLCAEPNRLLCVDKQGKILWQCENTVDATLTEAERSKWPQEEAALKEAEKGLAPLRAEFEAARAALKEAETEAKQNPQDGDLKKAVGGARRKVGEAQRRLDEALAKTEAGFPLAGRMRPAKTHPANGFSSDTPLFDAGKVYACFGNGVVSAYTTEGKRLWTRFVEKPTHVWGQCASPRLIGGVLVIQYVKAWGLDPATGEVKWNAPCPKAWGTPEPITVGRLTAFVTDQGQIRSSVDGALLAETAMKLEFGCPLVSGELVYGASTGVAWAMKVSEKDGKLAATELWKAEVGDKKERFYASPLLWEGVLYLVNQKSQLFALEAESGKKLFEQALGLGGTAYPSPILCGDLIVASSDTGKSVVFKAGREYKEISRPVLEPFRATPVCDGKRMYIRTLAKGPEKPGLYCLGE
ncbi:MAG: PQQ-binding-like beta-propeller repeat protein [Spirochaetes bacterium]|nr:PQQ-binding-like beta-propeller repeat protein [Spirochaetota bacterium]